jgi:FkbM family methyltransferase
MNAVKRLVVGTALERPLRRIYRRLADATNNPLLRQEELREARDDAYARALLRSALDIRSNCIDVGAHGGSFLRQFLEFAPEGRHYAFEPIPALAMKLRQEFPTVQVHDCALSDHEGQATFQYVPELPGWSGLRPQPYPVKANPQPIQVNLRRLDDVVPDDVSIRFIKIDVEGAELEVLNGAQDLLRRCHPIVYFECGKKHHTHYSTSPQQVFSLFSHCGMGVYLLDQTPLSMDEFVGAYEAHGSRSDQSTWGNYLAMPRPSN